MTYLNAVWMVKLSFVKMKLKHFSNLKAQESLF